MKRDAIPSPSLINNEINRRGENTEKYTAELHFSEEENKYGHIYLYKGYYFGTCSMLGTETEAMKIQTLDSETSFCYEHIGFRSQYNNKKAD